jgi:CDGSH-type Zn-finger protein
MARLVRHEATGPYRIDPPLEKPIFICGCGLSRNLPFCDGTHKTCRDELGGTLYVYDADRRTVIETREDAADGTMPSSPDANGQGV